MTHYQLPVGERIDYLQLALRPGGPGLVARWGAMSGPINVAAFDSPGDSPSWGRTGGPALILSPDGEWVSDFDKPAGTVTVTAVGAPEPWAVLGRDSDPNNVWTAVAPGGATVAWKDGPYTVVRALPGGGPVARLRSGSGFDLRFSPGGRWLTEMGEGVFRVFDRANGHKLFACLRAGRSYRAEVADGPTAVLAGLGRGRVEVYDLPAKSPSAAPPVGGWVLALAVSPDGRWVLTGNSEGELTVWGADGTRPRRYDWGVAMPVAATFARDGTCAAVGGTDGRVVVFDLDD